MPVPATQMASSRSVATPVSRAQDAAGEAAEAVASILAAAASGKAADGTAFHTEGPPCIPLPATADEKMQSEPFFTGRFAAVTCLVLLVLSASIFASTLLATNGHHLLLPLAGVIPHFSVSLLFTWVSFVFLSRGTSSYTVHRWSQLSHYLCFVELLPLVSGLAGWCRSTERDALLNE